MATVDPYKAGMFKKDPYVKKRDCEGTLCVVLDTSLENRGLKLMMQPSRALLAGEIHELIVTDEQDAKSGSEVNRIAYWGFFEVTKASVVISGDEISIGGKCKGFIAGFDETHMPNHLNIVVRAEKRVTGSDLGLELEDTVIITKASK